MRDQPESHSRGAKKRRRNEEERKLARRWSLPAREKGGREAPEERGGWRRRVLETRAAQPRVYSRRARTNQTREAQILIFSMYMDESWLGQRCGEDCARRGRTDEGKMLPGRRKRQGRWWWTYLRGEERGMGGREGGWCGCAPSLLPGGVRSERRRVAKLLSIFQPRKYRLPCSTYPFATPTVASAPWPRLAADALREYTLSVWWRSRLFVSPILMARSVDRLILAFPRTFRRIEIRTRRIQVEYFHRSIFGFREQIDKHKKLFNQSII